MWKVLRKKTGPEGPVGMNGEWEVIRPGSAGSARFRPR